MRFVTIQAFERMFSCRINSLPQNVCLVGWLKAEQRWYCAPEFLAHPQSTRSGHVFHVGGRKQLLQFLSTRVLPTLNVPSIWFPYSFYDGWRERTIFSPQYRWVVPPDMSGWAEWRGSPGETPILSPTRSWLLCLGAHRGDPSAFVVPDSHYLQQNHYVELFAEVRRDLVAWADRKPRAILAAGDHGENANFFRPSDDSTLHPRRLFQRTVADQGLAADVVLGQNVSLADQLGYRYIVDVDGCARTWTAWAWKMMSGATVLSVESPWTAFFTDQFSPWEHFVPVANDCSDLAEKLDWCRANDAECQAIAGRAQQQAALVYEINAVAERVVTRLRERLDTPMPADWAENL